MPNSVYFNDEEEAFDQVDRRSPQPLEEVHIEEVDNEDDNSAGEDPQYSPTTPAQSSEEG
mgnify:CR=1 FL=1